MINGFCLCNKWLLAIAILAWPLATSADDQTQPAKETKIEKQLGVKSSLLDKLKKKKPAAITQKNLLGADIFVGEIGEAEISESRCLDIPAFLQSIPETKEAEKCRQNGRQARYWILTSQANDRAKKEIREYVTKKDIYFLCKRPMLIALLRKQDKYDKKTDEELIAEFDITADIIKYFADKHKILSARDNFP